MLVPLAASKLDVDVSHARRLTPAGGHGGLAILTWPRREWIGIANQDVYMHRVCAKAIADQSQPPMTPHAVGDGSVAV